MDDENNRRCNRSKLKVSIVASVKGPEIKGITTRQRYRSCFPQTQEWILFDDLYEANDRSERRGIRGRSWSEMISSFTVGMQIRGVSVRGVRG